MATYYWIGGAGTWSNASNTNWSSTSGGTGGAGIPTSIDDVIFDSASSAAAYVVTVAATATANTVTISAPASGSITLSGGTITYFGNWTSPATNMVCSSAIVYSGNVTNSISTNNVAFTGAFTSNSSAGLVLASPFKTSSSITVLQGSFNTNTNAYYVETSSLVSSTTTYNRSITLNGSTLLLTGTSPVSMVSTNLTLNANTSNVYCSATSATFTAGNLTFNNVYFTGITGGVTIGAANTTFNNFSQTCTSGQTLSAPLAIATNVFITGTFTVNPTSSNATYRSYIYSTVADTQATISAGAVSLKNIDFYDIAATGAATWSGTNLGDAGNNTGITFPAAKTVYWNLAGTQNWWATGWASTSGGTPDANNFPLCQDTAIINNAGSAGTINFSTYYMPNLDMSGRTTAMTINMNGATVGNVTFSSTANVEYGGTTNFLSWYNRGNTIRYLQSNGRTVNCSIGVVTSRNSSLVLNDAMNTNYYLMVNRGILDLNNYTATCATSSGWPSTSYRAIKFGSNGAINFTTSGQAIFLNIGVELFENTGSKRLNFTYSGNSARSVYVANGMTEANAWNYYVNTGSGSFYFGNNGAGQVNDLNFLGFTGNIGHDYTMYCFGNVYSTGATTINAGTFWNWVFCTTKTVTLDTGTTFDQPMRFDGVGGTWKLANNFTNGAASSKTTTLYNGTIDLNGNKFSTGTLSIGAGTKAITFNGGNLVCAAAGTSFNNGNPSGFSTNTGTSEGCISLTNGAGATFGGGGSTYNCGLNLVSPGTLTITGANFFSNIYSSYTNTSGAVSTAITFPSSTTNTFTKWSLFGGGSHKPITVTSSTSGTAATISASSVDGYLRNMFFKDITATGTASWVSRTVGGNISNNTGFNFQNVASRLTNTGNMFASRVLDEITLNTHSITPNVTYSPLFNEIDMTGDTVRAKSVLSNGEVRIAGTFDDYTGL